MTGTSKSFTGCSCFVRLPSGLSWFAPLLCSAPPWTPLRSVGDLRSSERGELFTQLAGRLESSEIINNSNSPVLAVLVEHPKEQEAEAQKGPEE
ncbi:hypothetical protein SRHO_G00274520 [Serrasalmus rhombeus]